MNAAVSMNIDIKIAPSEIFIACQFRLPTYLIAYQLTVSAYLNLKLWLGLFVKSTAVHFKAFLKEFIKIIT